jgi:uncharacterized protein YjbI with pentapeptide repeats
MNKNELNLLLESHTEWLDDEGGERADLSGADLSEIDLSGKDLVIVNLRGANLRGANLFKADLRGADLSGADLYKANLSEANLEQANLPEADLNGANLNGANLFGADLFGCNLSGADLRGAKITAQELFYAITNKTKLDHILLKIEGSSFLFCASNSEIKIGCVTFTLDYWKKNYKEIAEKKNFGSKEIREYLNYIKIYEQLLKKG